MTTIVVVRKGGTAVIAADSLTTFGTTRLAPAYDRYPQKIAAYGDSFLGVAGSAAHQLVLENLLVRTPTSTSTARPRSTTASGNCTPCSRTRPSSTRRRKTTIRT